MLPEERFVLAGGGTGGHLYPGLAAADAVRRVRPEWSVCVYGTQRPIDESVVAPRGCALVKQVVRPMPTTRPWQWPGFVLAFRRAVAAASADFRRAAPLFVLGLGGYAAAPPVVAAARLGIPTALFNPDARPGRANRRLARYVQRVFVQWRETADCFAGCEAEVRVTGCPVRPAIVSATADAGRRAFDLRADRRTLLITGASQGARSINAACVALCDLLRRPDWQIVHLAGALDAGAVQQAYAAAGVDARVYAYSEELPLALAASDLVIARAGASTLAELTARGVASVLLPYPYDRKQHQRDNAGVLVRAGAAVMVDDRRDAAANAEALRPVLERLLSDAAERQRMADAARRLGVSDAADQMAAELLTMAAAGRAVGAAAMLAAR